MDNPKKTVSFVRLRIGLVRDPIRDVLRCKALLAKHAFGEKTSTR